MSCLNFGILHRLLLLCLATDLLVIFLFYSVDT